jgi:hypothetical protein
LVVSSLAWSLLAAPYLLLAFVAPVTALVAGAFVGGCGLAIGHSLWETTLQRRIPHRALSRVAAYDWFGSLAFNPIGYALMGPLAIAIGTRTTLLIAAAWFATSSVVLAALPSIRGVRQDASDLVEPAGA